MPTTGVPYRVFFFWFGSVAWFDDGPEGRIWQGPYVLEQLWPDLASMMPPSHPDKPVVEQAVPVSPSVLRLSRRSGGISQTAYIDVPRGVQVPPPDAAADAVGGRQIVSWDPGPILLALDAAGSSTRLVDLATGLRGPWTPFDWGNPDFPILAIPGEPVRRFWPTVPTQVEHRDANGNQVMRAFADEFPELVSLSGVEATTVMYGDFRRPSVARTTAALDDADVQALGRAAAVIGDDGPRLLAVLALLTGASPTSFHPDGHHGIAHMTEDQLVAGGWVDPPQAIVRAGARMQLDVLARYLATVPSSATDTPAKVLALLATGQAFADGTDTTVVASPVPARLANLAPTGADGAGATQITLGDLTRLVDATIEGPLGPEVFGRFRGSSFV